MRIILGHKERFAVTSSRPLAILIKFVDSSGDWVEGRLDPDADISDWCDYLFPAGGIPSGYFCTDRRIKMYDSAGDYQASYPAGTAVVPI